MKLSYNQLEITLTGHFRIHPDRFSTFRSRVKQLQRLKFPPGVNIGRGSKMEYSARHLFQLVSAFELINCGLPAATATNLVEENWRFFAAAYGLVATRRRKLKAGTVYILIENPALRDLMETEHPEDLKAEITVEDQESLEHAMMRCDDRRVHSFLLLCASDITNSITKYLTVIARLKNVIDDDEFDDWPVNYSHEDCWMRVGGGWHTEWEVPDD